MVDFTELRLNKKTNKGKIFRCPKCGKKGVGIFRNAGMVIQIIHSGWYDDIDVLHIEETCWITAPHIKLIKSPSRDMEKVF